MLLSHRGITLKAPRSLGEQLRRHREVYLGPGHVDMAKIGRQQGSRASTSTPSRYQAMTRWTARVCLRSWRRGCHRSVAGRRMPACCRRRRKTFKLLAGDGVAASRSKKSGAREAGLGRDPVPGGRSPAPGPDPLLWGRRAEKNLVSQMASRRSQRSTSQHRSRSPSLARSPAPYRTRSSVRYVGLPGASRGGQGDRRLEKALEFLVRVNVQLE